MSQHAIKSLGDGRYRAYAVLFGEATKTDLAREFFAPDTDFWLDTWEKIPMIYDHGMNEAMKGSNAIAGYWDKKGIDDIGVWVEGELLKSHEYKNGIEAMLEMGALKTSSDSLAHLVIREPQTNGAIKLTQWPLCGVSLTTTPCEWRMMPVAAVKSAFAVIGQEIAEAEAQKMEAEPAVPEPALKSQFFGDYAEADITASVVDSLVWRLQYDAIYDAFGDVQAGEMDWPAARLRLSSTLDEFKDLILKVADAVMMGQSEQTPEMAVKFLKAKKSNDGGGLVNGLTTAELRHVLVSGAKSYPERLQAVKAKREEEGRNFLTTQRQDEIGEVQGAVKAALESLQSLMTSQVAPAEQAETPDAALEVEALKAMRIRSHALLQTSTQ